MWRTLLAMLAVASLSGCASSAMKAHEQMAEQAETSCALLEAQPQCGSAPVNRAVKPKGAERVQDKSINPCHWQLKSKMAKALQDDLEFAKMGIDNYNNVNERQRHFERDWKQAATKACGPFKQDMVLNQSQPWRQYRSDLKSFNQQQQRYQQCASERQRLQQACDADSQQAAQLGEQVSTVDKVIYYSTMVPVYIIAVPFVILHAIVK